MVGLFAFYATLSFFLLWFVHIEAVRLLEDPNWPKQTYITEPDFHPPVLEITAPGQASKDGHLFFSPRGPKAAQTAPLIMDNDGELVWNGEVGLFAFDFGVQEYKGDTVLVAWNGSRFPEPKGRGHGTVLLWNQHYDLFKNVTLEDHFVEFNGERYLSNIDLHEHFITEKGTVLVLAYNVTQADLSSVGGPGEGWVVEGQVYEIDIETNEVLFRWKSLEHSDKLPFTASQYPIGSEGYNGKTREKAWGYFHHNAVTPFRDGYIISSRYFCSAVAVGRGGEVLWVVQGRDGGDFTLAGGNGTTSFCYQHDIRVVEEQLEAKGRLANLTISMHDNANCPIDKNVIPTSGKIFNIDFGAKLVTQTHRYLNESGLTYATAQGSHQLMSNGNIFEGHGYIPVIEEFSPNGTALCRWTFGASVRTTAGGFLSPEPEAVVLSYRAFKHPWVGCPRTRPRVVLRSIGKEEAPRGARVWVSWNGATEVEEWEIEGGIERPGYITTVAKTGFETVVEIEDVEFVEVRARTRGGRGCGEGVGSGLVFVTGVDKT